MSSQASPKNKDKRIRNCQLRFACKLHLLRWNQREAAFYSELLTATGAEKVYQQGFTTGRVLLTLQFCCGDGWSGSKQWSILAAQIYCDKQRFIESERCDKVLLGALGPCWPGSRESTCLTATTKEGTPKCTFIPKWLTMNNNIIFYTKKHENAAFPRKTDREVSLVDFQMQVHVVFEDAVGADPVKSSCTPEIRLTLERVWISNDPWDSLRFSTGQNGCFSYQWNL